QRGRVFETVEAAPRRDLVLLEQTADLLESFVEARAALVHRDAKAGKLVGQEGACEANSRRPPEIASTIPIWPASLSGLLNTGSTAPVMSRIERVIAAAALRKMSGSGL